MHLKTSDNNVYQARAGQCLNGAFYRKSQMRGSQQLETMIWAGRPLVSTEHAGVQFESRNSNYQFLCLTNTYLLHCSPLKCRLPVRSSPLPSAGLEPSSHLHHQHNHHPSKILPYSEQTFHQTIGSQLCVLAIQIPHFVAHRIDAGIPFVPKSCGPACRTPGLDVVAPMYPHIPKNLRRSIS